jgi:YD repeat-containing protein
MKQMTFRNVLSVVACVLMLCVLAPTLTVADQAQYIYDDLGRLSQVIDGQGNVATYTYDAVGNLPSITRNTGGVGAPTITALTLNTGNAGASVTVTLTGTNLTGATAVTVTATTVLGLAGLLKTLEERLPAWKNADSYSPSDRAG